MDSKQIIKTIKKYDITELLLIDFRFFHKEELDPTVNTSTDDMIIDNQDANRDYLFKIFDSLKLQYHFLDISSNISHHSLIALLANYVTQYNTRTIIDVSFCPKAFLPLILQTVYYIPNLIEDVFMFDNELGLVSISYPIVSLDFDPDKETDLLKEILSLFLTNQKYYADFAFNKTLSSTILLQLINDEQTSNGQKEFKYPYIQACLSLLTQEQKGKSVFLQRRHNSSDRRALVYTITDQGVLTLFIWYLQQKVLTKENTPLFTKLDTLFGQIEFGEIESSSRSHSKVCTICESKNLSELFTCSLCGQESCKECLDSHFLNNKCQPQLQIA